jgi:hypothetical protein
MVTSLAMHRIHGKRTHPWVALRARYNHNNTNCYCFCQPIIVTKNDTVEIKTNKQQQQQTHSTITTTTTNYTKQPQYIIIQELLLNRMKELWHQDEYSKDCTFPSSDIVTFRTNSIDELYTQFTTKKNYNVDNNNNNNNDFVYLSPDSNTILSYDLFCTGNCNVQNQSQPQHPHQQLPPLPQQQQQQKQQQRRPKVFVIGLLIDRRTIQINRSENRASILSIPTARLPLEILHLGLVLEPPSSTDDVTKTTTDSATKTNTDTTSQCPQLSISPSTQSICKSSTTIPSQTSTPSTTTTTTTLISPTKSIRPLHPNEPLNVDCILEGIQQWYLNCCQTPILVEQQQQQQQQYYKYCFIHGMT